MTNRSRDDSARQYFEGSGQAGAMLGRAWSQRKRGRYQKKRAPGCLGALLPEDSLSGNPSRVKKNGELPFGADTVLEDGGAVLVDGHLELGGPGGGFRELVRGGEHLPIAADGFVDFDGDGRVLVVAQGDLELHFPHMSVDALVIGLLAFRDEIKGVADVH